MHRIRGGVAVALPVTLSWRWSHDACPCVRGTTSGGWWVPKRAILCQDKPEKAAASAGIAWPLEAQSGFPYDSSFILVRWKTYADANASMITAPKRTLTCLPYILL
jgi:hypothetical protein